MRRGESLLSLLTLYATVSSGQIPVCDLLNDLKSAESRLLLASGDLILSKDIAVIVSGDCDETAITLRRPTGLLLRPSARVPAAQLSQFEQAAAEADRYRKAGKTITASALVEGRLRVGPADGFPAEFTFDSISSLKIQVQPDSKDLPVIPICELFQGLEKWRGQRIAIRGETVGSDEGSWLIGRCRGGFYTDGYRWPISVSLALPTDYSRSIEPLLRTRYPQGRPKDQERQEVRRDATVVGRLRLRNEYHAFCQGGRYLGNGFGHLNAAAAEIVLEEERDIKFTRRQAEDPIQEENR